MRNSTVVLSAADKARATKAKNMLAQVQYGDRVLVNFTKRDGTVKRMEGHIVNIVGGTPDKEAVVLDTIEGPRSANLWSIKSVNLL